MTRTVYPFPNAVLCDYKLGGEDVSDFLTWVKSGQGRPKMPVYILAGGAAPYQVNQMKKLGAVEVLRKPPDFVAFRQMLADLGAKMCGFE